MTGAKRRFDLRQHHRFQVKDGAIAVLYHQSKVKLGLISDISKGGLAFSYIDHNIGQKLVPTESSQLKITWKERGFCLDNLSCKVLMDQDQQPEYSFIQLPMKKCRIAFAELTGTQLEQLDDLLNSFVVGSVWESDMDYVHK